MTTSFLEIYSILFQVRKSKASIVDAELAKDPSSTHFKTEKELINNICAIGKKVEESGEEHDLEMSGDELHKTLKVSIVFVIEEQPSVSPWC
jgi:hypothetical protein